MRLRNLLLALALTFSGLLAVVPTEAPAEAATPVHVTIKNMAFTPSVVTIHRGRTVVWTNRDLLLVHSVVITSGPRLFHSSLLLPGGSFSHTFNVRGTYRYKCGVHPMMRGTIKVVV
ncbi:MAG TPA: cupredoxin domain-containing protein [Nocardioides sp.]|nr:cupredoxin domain-containing protein [Nocardioides sp.]